jgi:hypothetical protein
MNATKRMSDAIATGATIIAIATTATAAIGIAANGDHLQSEVSSVHAQQHAVSNAR